MSDETVEKDNQVKPAGTGGRKRRDPNKEEAPAPVTGALGGGMGGGRRRRPGRAGTVGSMMNTLAGDSVVTATGEPGQSEYADQEMKPGLVWEMVLPASGRKQKFTLQVMKPSLAEVWGGNPRASELLDIRDRNIAVIRESMMKRGQRDPVLARPKDGGGIEVLEGKTRHFIAKHIEENADPEFEFWAWVGDVDNEDALLICTDFHNERNDLSPYEEALYIQDCENGAHGVTLTTEEICGRLRINERTVYRRKQMLTIPIKVVRLLSSPALLSPAGAKKLSDIKEKSKFAGTWNGIATKLEGRIFESEKDLQDAVKKIVAPDAPSQSPAITGQDKEAVDLIPKSSTLFGNYQAGRGTFEIKRGTGGKVQINVSGLGSEEKLAKVKAAVQAALEDS